MWCQEIGPLRFFEVPVQKNSCCTSDSDDGPDVLGSCQGEDQAGKENRGSRPFKLSSLPVVEVRAAQFDKERDGEDHVQRGKYHIVHHGFDLACGKVVDMFYFPLIETTFPDWLPIWGGQEFIFFRPIFNLADSAICVGVFSLLLFYRHTLSKSLSNEEK